MIPALRFPAMLVWAARDIQRHAGRSLLLVASLASLVCLIATALLFSRALDATWSHLLDQAPDLVVRRVNGGGWLPMPAAEALACARTVPGVIDPTPRVWGVVPGPMGPVTVVAALPFEKDIGAITPPSPGHAIVGRGLDPASMDGRLTLGGSDPLTVEVAGTFEKGSGLATHDLVWLAPDDARTLLGLLPDQASDLAVHLFHREEERAVQADLAAAFPWPVHITDRSTSALRHRSLSVRTGGIALTAAIPALLALLLIVIGTAAGDAGSKSRWGLYKAMGWTTADIVRLQVGQAMIVAVPAVAGGLVLAYMAVFYPPVAGVTAFWVTGGLHLPTLVLDRVGAVPIMLEIAVMVGLPYLAAVFLSTLRGAVDDPWTLFEADPWS